MSQSHQLLSAFLTLLFFSHPLRAEVIDKPEGTMPPETQPSTIDEYNEADSIDPRTKSTRKDPRPGPIQGGPSPTDTTGLAGGASGRPESESADEKSTEPSESFAKDVRKELDRWDQRVITLRQSAMATANRPERNQPRLKAANSIEKRATSVKEDLDALEKARLAGENREWQKIKSRMENQLQAMQQEFDRVVAE